MGNLDRLSISTFWNPLAPIETVNGSEPIAKATAKVAAGCR